MAIKYGFFNSVGNDRTYNADDMSNYFEGLVSNGVYATVGDACIVRSLGGLTLSIGTGRAILNNKWVKIDSIQAVTITPHTSLNRYDAICLQINATDRNISLVVVEGTPATAPTVPAKTANQLVLAHIYVRANTSSISQADITDRRPYKDYCGWVTGLVDQVDTSELFLQFQTACEEKQNEMNQWKSEQISEFDKWKSQQIEDFVKWQSQQVAEFEKWKAQQMQFYEKWKNDRTNVFETWQSEKKTEYRDWFDNLTESLTVNVNPATSRTYTVETDESGHAELPFTYNDSQAVHVYINGSFAVEDEDYYTIENGNIQLTSLEFGSGSDVITFVVFKAGVVSGSSGIVDDEEISVSDIENMVSEIDGLK